MKKTYNELRERINNTLVLLVLTGILLSLPIFTLAQIPSCSKFSVGINADGQSVITAKELLGNEPALPLHLIIRAQNFNTIYEGEVTNLDGKINLELCDYINQNLIFELKNEAGNCSDTLKVSLPPIPIVTGRRITVLCSNSLVEPGQLIGDTFPIIKYNCGSMPELKINEDFQETNDCSDYDEAIMQTIYRELEGYDDWGRRFSTFDTIIVYKHPEITAYHIDLDTLYHVYCGENDVLGPQVYFTNPVSGQMDTISLLKAMPVAGRKLKFEPSKLAELCNMNLDVTSSIINNTKCEKRYQVNMELDQDCFFADGTKPLTGQPQKGLTFMERGRYRLAFSVLDVDTLAPDISIGKLITTTYTSVTGCEAPLVFPPINIDEKCSGVRRVQASVPGFFTVNMIQDKKGLWVPDEKVTLPKDGMDYMEQDTTIVNAFKVIIEASDSCDLTSQDSFYIQVEDNTKPTVSLLKNIRVGLTGQLTWIDVSIMNEGSYDNCGVAMVLGRRTDWATTGNINLCDGLERDKRINPVESYYATFLQELMDGNSPCGNWLYDEWMKDSLKLCRGNLPDGMVSEVGGGWTTQIPFTCADACQDIEVELLVIDNWCNWNTTRATVKVKDKQPITIVQDLKNTVSMNCSSYSGYYADVINRALVLNKRPQSDASRVVAFNAIDSLLGGYVTVWQDLDGQLITNEGQKIIPSEHHLNIRKDQCENFTQQKSVKVFDENSGTFVSSIQNVPSIRSVPSNEQIDNGIVAVNCSSSTYQKIFVDIDQCGAGTIRRRFYVAGGCGEMGEGDWLTRNADRIEYTREQIIYIEPDCALSAGMIEMPPEVSAIDVCKIEKNGNGNYIGELHPDFTGWPKYTWSLGCRDLSVGYQDKLFRLFGNNPVGQWKLVRNWHISDQCDGSEEGDVLHFEQVLIIKELEQCDSTVNQFLISGQVQDPEGAPIEHVSMRLQSDQDERVAAQTSVEGTYSIAAEKDKMYRVIPYMNDQMLKGISTFDLVMIQKDILNIKRLDNVYRRIAADINNNGLIEATDVIELRKAILRPNFVFSNNTSYQFRAAGSNANFSSVDKLDKNTTMDFVGIKIGDVNFSAGNAVPTSRSSGMQMFLQNQWLQGDVTYRIPVRNAKAMDVLGFQFEWELKSGAVSSISLEPASLDITSEEFAVIDNSKLTVSWFDIDERHLKENEVLFYINIKTKHQTTLQNMIHMSSDILTTESYVEPGIVKSLSFSFRDMQGSVSKIQNHPNPFRDRTIIRFDQENVGPVDITLHDMTGKLILHRRMNGLKGNNEIIVSGTDLPGPGMFYYKITTPERQWTNKMIYIK